jgi:hypothetical protein
MIAEILAVVGIGGVTYASLDHENLLPWSATVDGSKRWFWEKPPFAPQTPAVGARLNQPIQPRLSPAQELQQARMGVVAADQMLNSVSKKFPMLAVQSKYALSSQPQQPDLVYRPKTYP